MEANNHAFQATLHSCAKPTNGHYDICDRMGCAENTRTQHGAYGPGSEFRIDTRLPFDVHTEFLEDDGVLTGMRTILHQAGKHLVLGHSNCAGADLAKLSDAMKDGMSLRITYWGEEAQTMAWMDSPPCGPQSCSGKNAGDAVISNISVSRKMWQDFPAPVPKQEPWSAGGQWNSPPTEAPWKPKDSSKEYTSDWSQPWMCHAYTAEQKKVKNWCASAGFEDGYEYEYNGGHDSQCGVCWCCRRKAKVSWVPDPTKEHAAKVVNDRDADATPEDQLVWVVIDPTDMMYGRIVPSAITEDPTLFVSLHGRGVADWEQDGRVVKRLKHSEFKLLQKKKKATDTQVKEDGGVGADCNGDDDSPCGTSIKKESAYFNILMQKYAPQGHLPDLAAKWWPGAIALVLLAFVVVAGISLGVRRHLLQSVARSSGSPAAPMAPSAGATTTGAAAEGGAALAAPGSDMGSVASNAASASSPMRRLPRAGSSCQRLLSLQEALA
jgi:hypothetical protein